jgi:uncharacterized RDD family membrane protein YckC
MYSIETPENVNLGYEIAGLGSRFLAAVVDSLVITLLLVVTYLATIAFLITPLGETLSGWLGDWIVAIYFLITFALLWGYYIFFEIVWNGQSLGKRWFGLRVIRTDGMPISIVESVVRNLVRIVDFMPLYYGLGVAVMLLNASARRLGDLAAGTVVVKERQDVTLAAIGKAAAPFIVRSPDPLIAALGDPAAWPIERLADNDFYVVKEFLRRRHGLLNRAALAVKLAARLCQQLDLALPTGPWTPRACEAFLEQLAALEAKRST